MTPLKPTSRCSEDRVAAHYTTVRLPTAFRDKLLALFEATMRHGDGIDAQRRSALRKRLVELDRQEDRYLELALEPDWPKVKLTEKLRQIRDERARTTTTLEQTVVQLDRGYENIRRVLSYLSEPKSLYDEANTTERTKLNRLIFIKLTVDVANNGTRVRGAG